MRLREHPLELLQLRTRECGPDAPLLPLLVQPAVVREQLVGNWRRRGDRVPLGGLDRVPGSGARGHPVVSGSPSGSQFKIHHFV